MFSWTRGGATCRTGILYCHLGNRMRFNCSGQTVIQMQLTNRATQAI